MEHLWENDQPDRCEHCGAGDDAHHSYTCPTGKHPDREFQPEYFSGLNWREAEKLVGKVVEFSFDGDIWSRGRLNGIVQRDFATYRYKKQSGVYYIYIRTTPKNDAHPTIAIGGVKLPRPEVEAPEFGTVYWYRDPYNSVQATRWYSDCGDLARLNTGELHLTEARAQAWADWWENTVMAAVRGGCDENQN
jgi:hypothetical protein